MEFVLLDEMRSLGLMKRPDLLLLVGMISEQCGNPVLSWISNNSHLYLCINMFFTGCNWGRGEQWGAQWLWTVVPGILRQITEPQFPHL